VKGYLLFYPLYYEGKLDIKLSTFRPDFRIFFSASRESRLNKILGWRESEVNSTLSGFKKQYCFRRGITRKKQREKTTSLNNFFSKKLKISSFV